MTLERLRCFAAVAERLNFTKAAQDCHMAQTAMSRQIAMLEEELGCRLFQRDNRTVSLTPAGKAFYEGIAVVLQKYGETVERTRAAGAGMDGSIRIGIGQYERNFVSELVREFHEKYPGIQVAVFQYQYKDLVRSLQNGTVDVVFALPISAEYVAGQRVEIQELFTSELCAFLGRGHRLSTRRMLCRADLEGENVYTIGEDEGPCSMESFWELTKRYQLPVRTAIQANSLEAVFLMLEAGMGVAFGPYFMKDSLPVKLTAVRLEPGFYPKEKFVSMILQDNKNAAARIFVNGIGTSKTLWERLERCEEEEAPS